jgi:hypothetical protein
MKTSFLFIFLLLTTETIGQRLSDKEYSTYSKVIDWFLKSENISKDIVIVRETENRFEILKDIMRESPVGQIQIDSLSVTSDKLNFDSKLKLKKFKSTIVPDSVIRDLLWDENGDVYYDPFYKAYPATGGFIEMSRLFYTKDKTKGALYISIHRDSLDGAGFFLYFDITDKKLVILKKMTWVS